MIEKHDWNHEKQDWNHEKLLNNWILRYRA